MRVSIGRNKGILREFPVRSKNKCRTSNWLKELAIFVEDNLRLTLFLNFLLFLNITDIG